MSHVSSIGVAAARCSAAESGANGIAASNEELATFDRKARRCMGGRFLMAAVSPNADWRGI
jgi:hypothetical protein